MKNKSQNMGVRKRNKPNNHQNDTNQNETNGQCKKLLINGNNKLIEDKSWKEGKFIERLGSLLRNSQLNWLKEICIREFRSLSLIKDHDENRKVEIKGENRRSYFSVRLGLSLTLVLFLTFSTRLYQVDMPTHVW